MATILGYLQTFTAYLFGGTTVAEGTTAATTISFNDSILGKVVTAVTGNPILLMFVLIGLVGLGIGLFKRLTRG